MSANDSPVQDRIYKNRGSALNRTVVLVRDTGFEPVTSSVSRKRATAAPIAPIQAANHLVEVGTGFEPAYTALQAAASPLGHPTTSVTSTVPLRASKWFASGQRDSNPRPPPWQGGALAS